MIEQQPSSRFKRLGVIIAMTGLMAGISSAALADFSDGQIASPTTTTTSTTGSAGTNFGPGSGTPPGCLPAQQTATTAQVTYAQGQDNAIIAALKPQHSSVGQICGIGTIMQMLNQLESLFSGGGLGTLFENLANSLLNEVANEVCSVISSSISSVTGSVGSLTNTGQITSLLTSATGSSGSPLLTNAVGTAGNSVTNSLTSPSPVTVTPNSNVTVLQQLFGSGSTTSTTGSNTTSTTGTSGSIWNNSSQ